MSRSRGTTDDSWTTWLGVPLDVVLSMVWLAIAYATVMLSPGTPVRVFAALVTLLFLPGYALTTALFPATRPPQNHSSIFSPMRNGSVSSLSDQEREFGALAGGERAALSFGLSIASLPLMGLVVQVTYGTFELRPLLTILAGFVLIPLAIGIIRRKRTPASRRYDVPLSHWLSSGRSTLHQREKVDLVLNIALAAAVMVAMSTLTLAMVAPQDGNQFTEAYLLAEQENGDFAGKNYPTDYQQGESKVLVLQLTNKEGMSIDYTVVVVLQRLGPNGNVREQTRLHRFQHRIVAGESWQKQHEVTPTMIGDQLRLTYLIYKGQPPAELSTRTAYRHVSLQINVTAPPNSGS